MGTATRTCAGRLLRRGSLSALELRLDGIRQLEGGTYAVTGDLTIKDVTREITVEATVQGIGEDPWGNQRAGVAMRGSIDRTEFGLTWQSRLAGGGLLVGEEVNLLLDLSAVAS